MLHGKAFRPLMDNDEVERMIDGVAEKLNRDFGDGNEIPIFLCVLNGAIMFTAALMKRVRFQTELASVKMSSYHGTHSTGTVLMPIGLTCSVEGRTVIIVEDIVDTGTTIVALKELLLSKGARDVRICTMLFKPEVYRKPDRLDYVGAEVPNAFIVGYGLDYDELGRNYDGIYVLEK